MQSLSSPASGRPWLMNVLVMSTTVLLKVVFFLLFRDEKSTQVVPAMRISMSPGIGAILPFAVRLQRISN